MAIELIDWLIIYGLLAVGGYICAMNLTVTFMKGDLERLESKVSKLEDGLRDLRTDLRSLQVDVSILESGQARLNDTFPEMRSAVRNLKVDMAAAKRWS